MKRFFNLTALPLLLFLSQTTLAQHLPTEPGPEMTCELGAPGVILSSKITTISKQIPPDAQRIYRCSTTAEGMPSQNYFLLLAFTPLKATAASYPALQVHCSYEHPEGGYYYRDQAGFPTRNKPHTATFDSTQAIMNCSIENAAAVDQLDFFDRNSPHPSQLFIFKR